MMRLFGRDSREARALHEERRARIELVQRVEAELHHLAGVARTIMIDHPPGNAPHHIAEGMRHAIHHIRTTVLGEGT